jgi:hypothetical protein
VLAEMFFDTKTFGHCLVVIVSLFCAGTKAQIPIYLPGGHCLVIPLSLRHR